MSEEAPGQPFDIVTATEVVLKQEAAEDLRRTKLRLLRIREECRMHSSLSWRANYPVGDVQFLLGLIEDILEVTSELLANRPDGTADGSTGQGTETA